MASKPLKEQVEQRLIEMLSPVDWRLVVSQHETNKKLIYVGGELLDASRMANLQSEADFLVNSEIWKLLNETPKALAEKAMFVNGETFDDIKKGRAMLFHLANQKKIVDLFRTYTQPKQ